ncbi:YggT family protein [bacterium]|nr:YggT family protein [bacterium]
MANAFVVSLMEVVLIVVQMLYYVIIARAIVSWFSPNPYNPIVQFLYSITEPMLRPIRRVLQMIFGIRRFDLSPMVAILLLFLIQQFLRRLALATL